MIIEHSLPSEFRVYTSGVMHGCVQHYDMKVGYVSIKHLRNLSRVTYISCGQIVVTDMAGFDDPTGLLSIISALLMILLNAQNILGMASIPIEATSHEDFIMHMEEGTRHMENIFSTSIAALYSYLLWNNLLLADHELGYWVKPRSTTWFSRFVIEEYDDARWSSLFRMTKASVF